MLRSALDTTKVKVTFIPDGADRGFSVDGNIRDVVGCNRLIKSVLSWDTDGSGGTITVEPVIWRPDLCVDAYGDIAGVARAYGVEVGAGSVVTFHVGGVYED
jgi:hypothetical protein